MRNNFLICTLLAGLTHSIQLHEHLEEHVQAIERHHDADKADQPTKDQLIELKERDRLVDLDFLQTDTEASSGTCGAWHDRVKDAQNIFYGVQSGSTEFVDSTFPHGTAIRDDNNPSFVNGGGL